VIRQLIEFIGDEAFLAGIHEYLTAHSYGNGTLADFLAAMERASGQELATWSRAWLETAGVDALALERETGTLVRTVPEGHPADRPHAMDVATYEGGVETSRVAVQVAGERTTVEGLDLEAPLVLPNAADLTWATPLLDDTSLGSLLAQLPRMSDERARAVLWVALRDGAA